MGSTTCKYETANLSRFSKESHKQTSASFIPFSLFSLYAMTDSEEEQHNRSRTSNRIAPHCSWTNLLIVLSPRPWMSGASSAASPPATGRAIAVSPCRGTSTGLASEEKVEEQASLEQNRQKENAACAFQRRGSRAKRRARRPPCPVCVSRCTSTGSVVRKEAKERKAAMAVSYYFCFSGLRPALVQ